MLYGRIIQESFFLPCVKEERIGKGSKIDHHAENERCDEDFNEGKSFVIYATPALYTRMPPPF